MKLHLMIAVVMYMRVAVANSSSEVVEQGQHVTDATRSGTSSIRNLKSWLAPRFAEELENAFISHATNHFNYDAKKPAISVEDLKQKMKDIPKSGAEEWFFYSAGMSWNDVDLFRNPAFHYYASQLPPKTVQEKSELLYYKLMEAHGHDIAAVVKTLNAGRMDGERNSRNWAVEVEKQMLSHLNEKLEMSPEEFFRKLKLNQIADERELYGNPAFATWIAYVRLHANKWHDAIFNVLMGEGYSNFKGLAEYAEYKTGKRLKPLAKEWSHKMTYISENHDSWHTLLPVKKN